MRSARTATAVLAGGILALTAAAPALADDTTPPPPPGGTIAVSTSFDTRTAQSGDTVTLTITSRQKTESFADGSFAIYWTGPITYVGHGADSKCAAKQGYVWCPELTSHILKSDSFTFTADSVTGHDVVKVRVKATSGGSSATGSVALNVVPAATRSPSPSPSTTSSSPEPSTGTTAEPSTSSTASASPSSSSAGPSGPAGSDSPVPSPSVSVVASSGGLPVTGTPLAVLTAVGAAILAAGAGVVVLSRRRRRTT